MLVSLVFCYVDFWYFLLLSECLLLLKSLLLAASLAGIGSPLQMREKVYLLAVGHYRSGDYLRSMQLVEQCLEV